MRISDWSSDVCSSDLPADQAALAGASLVDLPDPVPCRRRADLRCHHAGLQPARRRAERALRAQGAGGGRDRRRRVRLLPVGPAPRRGGAVSARPVGQWLLVLAGVVVVATVIGAIRSEEHTSELQSLMRISYAVFCLKKKKVTIQKT